MSNKIVFYTIECPKCRTLEILLKRFNVVYETCEDVKIMISKNITSAPALEVEGQILDFSKAVKWLNETFKK